MNLPTELLRSFAAIVDSGSMLRATERVFVTQSALSLQMKRLEETVQSPLFHRDGRRLTLTPAGQTLLAFAREMLGVNDRAVAALTGDALREVIEGFGDFLIESVQFVSSCRGSRTKATSPTFIRASSGKELLANSETWHRSLKSNSTLPMDSIR